MRWSRYFLPTLREDPKDAEAVSHKLMARAGLIRRLGSGTYSYLPFGLRALQKAASIVREEMNRAGAQEVLLPALQPLELWKATGRDALLGDVLIRVKDRTGRELALGPTHEEVITDLLKELRSPKQLPLTVYQIQTKFRDEPRPRFGVIRSKEFLMKDAYSFDQDAEGLQRSYQAMYDAYQRIFARCGLTVLACEADPGMMGGEVSHEFMAPAESGEDRVVRCGACGYAANLEAASCEQIAHSTPACAAHLGTPLGAAGRQHTEAQKPMEAVETPGRHTVAEISALLKVPPSRLIKTLLYEAGQDAVAVLVRGDHDVNEAKLARRAGLKALRLASPRTIERLSGAPVGFTGPVGLQGVRLLADRDVMTVVNAVTGANRAETHHINVNPGRDFTPELVADLRMVTEHDRCPRCQQPLAFIKAIEVGHVFKLGTRYSQALGAVIQDAAGAVRPMVMGCYGVGVNRIVASAIEQHHDAHGIVWPIGLAPFQVLVTVLEADRREPAEAGTAAYEALQGAGYEVLLDDRVQSPGSKLKDADLIGLPVRVVVGKAWQERRLEVSARATRETLQCDPAELPAAVARLIPAPA